MQQMGDMSNRQSPKADLNETASHVPALIVKEARAMELQYEPIRTMFDLHPEDVLDWIRSRQAVWHAGELLEVMPAHERLGCQPECTHN